MTEPLVSLILPSYNYEAYIGDAIRSILAQTYPHWELLVIDDASTDGSLDVIRSFSDPRVKLLRSEINQGPSAAYNRAYTHCRGEYIGSLDADDLFAPHKLERQVETLEAHPDLDVLGTYVAEIDAAGQSVSGETAAWFNQERDLDAIENWLLRNHLCHSSALLRSSAHDRIGPFNPQLRVAGDFELWLRGLALGVRFRALPEPLLHSRQHGFNAWSRIPRDHLFLELAYLFSAHLARFLVASGQDKHLSPCLSFLASDFLAGAEEEDRSVALRELRNFRRHPRDFAGFAAAFASGCDPHWPAIVEALLAPAPRRASPPVRSRWSRFNGLWSGFGVPGR